MTNTTPIFHLFARIVLRFMLFVAGLVVVLTVLAGAVLFFLIWCAKLIWYKLTNRTIKPWHFNTNGMQAFYRYSKYWQQNPAATKKATNTRTNETKDITDTEFK